MLNCFLHTSDIECNTAFAHTSEHESLPCLLYALEAELASLYMQQGLSVYN